MQSRGRVPVGLKAWIGFHVASALAVVGLLVGPVWVAISPDSEAWAFQTSFILIVILLVGTGQVPITLGLRNVDRGRGSARGLLIGGVLFLIFAAFGLVLAFWTLWLSLPFAATGLASILFYQRHGRGSAMPETPW